MRLILLLAIASVVGGSAVSAVKFLMSPAKSNGAQLLESYRQNPASTLKSMETSLSSCLPEGQPGEVTLKARQMVAQLFILMVDLKSRNASEEALKLEFDKWQASNAKRMVSGMSGKQIEMFMDYLKAAGKPGILSCVVSRSA
jgi:hypothetical protein